MVKISDHVRSIVHDFYRLYVKEEDSVYGLICEGDYVKIQSVIESLESAYYIERYTVSQYVPKERRFKLNGK